MAVDELLGNEAIAQGAVRIVGPEMSQRPEDTSFQIIVESVVQMA
jgi:hypothetical protein